MRILWHSNGPNAKTAYGVQTAIWVPRLAALGHEIAISAFHGVEGGPMTWQGHTVYPKGKHMYGSDIVGMHARHFKADWVITLMDQWALGQETLDGLRVACWMPVDCTPLGTYDVDHLNGEENGPIPDQPIRYPIALTHFGRRILDEAGYTPDKGYPSWYVPHGIDTNVFRPPGDRKALREAMGLDDRFVVFMNAKNLDKARKNFPNSLAAFAKFHAKHPDALLMLHTSEIQQGQGLNIRQLVNRFGIADSVKFTSQYLMETGLIRTEMLPGNYAAADVYLGPSLAEGFGLPHLEAQACGTPVIATDCSAMSEVCAGQWLLKVGPAELEFASGHDAWWYKPCPDAIARALEVAYDKPAVRAAKGKAGIEHAKGYDIETVLADCWAPTLKQLEDML